MKQLTKTELDKIKLTYCGRKIRIVHVSTNETDNANYAGKDGVVYLVDDMGFLHGTWGGISMSPTEDELEVLPTTEGKVYHFHSNVGKAKYLVDYHDGFQVHNDGSAFFGCAIFSNKKKRDQFVRELNRQGYSYKI